MACFDTAFWPHDQPLERRSGRVGPERSLLAVLAAHPRHEGLVGLVLSEVAEICGQPGAFQQMARGVLVAAGSTLIERKFDHGAQRQRRRQWVFPGQGFGDRRQNFIAISVEILRAL